MRVPEDPRLPEDWLAARRQLDSLYRQVATQLNMLSEGGITAITNATTAAPTTGTYAAGDIVRHATPVEAGSSGSKYVLYGWICTVAGTPGTWTELRSLTGA